MQVETDRQEEKAMTKTQKGKENFCAFWHTKPFLSQEKGQEKESRMPVHYGTLDRGWPEQVQIQTLFLRSKKTKGRPSLAWLGRGIYWSAEGKQQMPRHFEIGHTDPCFNISAVPSLHETTQW